MLNTYTLFAGWEVHTVKNCDRGLENAAFSGMRSQFFTIQTDLSRQITFLFFPHGKLAYKLVCLHNFVIKLAYVPSTHHRKKSNKQTNK